MGFVDMTLLHSYLNEDGHEICGHTFDEVSEVSLNDRRGVLAVTDGDNLNIFPWRNVAVIELKGISITYENI